MYRKLRYNARVCICMYLTRISVAVPCFALAAGPAAAVSLLAGAVRHRVPNGTISRCVFFNLISVFSFSIISKHFFFMYPLAVLSHVQPGFTHETSSVIRGMRGNKPGVSPQR